MKKKEPNSILENHKLKNDIKKLKTDLGNWKTLYAQTAQSEALLKRKFHSLMMEQDRLLRQISQLQEQLEFQQKTISEMKEHFDLQ